MWKAEKRMGSPAEDGLELSTVGSDDKPTRTFVTNFDPRMALPLLSRRWNAGNAYKKWTAFPCPIPFDDIDMMCL